MTTDSEQHSVVLDASQRLIPGTLTLKLGFRVRVVALTLGTAFALRVKPVQDRGLVNADRASGGA